MSSTSRSPDDKPEATASGSRDQGGGDKITSPTKDDTVAEKKKAGSPGRYSMSDDGDEVPATRVDSTTRMPAVRPDAVTPRSTTQQMPAQTAPGSSGNPSNAASNTPISRPDRLPPPIKERKKPPISLPSRASPQPVHTTHRAMPAPLAKGAAPVSIQMPSDVKEKEIEKEKEESVRRPSAAMLMAAAAMVTLDLDDPLVDPPPPPPLPPKKDASENRALPPPPPSSRSPYAVAKELKERELRRRDEEQKAAQPPPQQKAGGEKEKAKSPPPPPPNKPPPLPKAATPQPPKVASGGPPPSRNTQKMTSAPPVPTGVAASAPPASKEAKEPKEANDSKEPSAASATTATTAATAAARSPSVAPPPPPPKPPTLTPPPPSRRISSLRPPPPAKAASLPPPVELDLDEGSIAFAFDALVSEDQSIQPGTHQFDLAPVRELFSALAANHMRHVRDFMIDVKWGEVTRDWIHICLPPVRTLRRAAERLDLEELAAALEKLGSELDAANAQGGQMLDKTEKEQLLSTYGELVTILPQAFALDRDKTQREAVIVQALLLQVPDVRKVTIDKLHAAGLTSLTVLFEANAHDIAHVAGIQHDTASKIVERVQSYRAELKSSSPQDARAAEREKLASLNGQLKQHHDAYELAATGWGPDAKGKKRDHFRAREETWLEISVLLARFGEVDRLQGIEKVPFAQRISQLTEYLEEARDKYRSAEG